MSDQEDFVNKLLRDAVGSRIIEMIIKVSSNETIQLIWDTYFKDEQKLFELCEHPAGNFAVQRMFERLRNPEDISFAVDLILSEAMDLICNHPLSTILISRFIADLRRDSSLGRLYTNKHRLSKGS